MSWDPSIALKGGAAPVLPNAFDFVGGLQGLQKRQHENLLFQLQNDARIATGEAYKKATRPDGTLDDRAVIEYLSQDPRGAIAIPEAYASAQAREKERQQIQMKTLELAQQRIGMFGNVLGGLLEKGESVSDRDVYTAVSKLATQVGDPELTKTMLLGLKDMPKGGKPLQAWLTQQNLQLMSTKDRIDAAFPQLIPVNDGAETNLVLPNRLPGQGGPRITGSIENMPSPAERNALVPGARNAQGAPIAVTREEVAPMVGGRGTPSSVTPAPGARVIGIGVEAEADLKGSADAYNKRMDDLNNQLLSAQKNMQEIGKMRDLLEQIGTGPVAGVMTTAAQYVNQLGFPEFASRMQGGASPDSVAAAEAFMKKAWAQSLSSMKSAMPAGTQWTGQEVFQNFENSPNLRMTPQAVRDLFDFETFRYNFLKEEQNYKNSWRVVNGDKPLRQMESDWVKHAEKQGWVKPVETGRGEGATGIINAPLRRDDTIPKDITLVDLSMIPRGSTRTFELDNGTRVKIRRGVGTTNGNTYEVVR